jgi:sulfate transport system permease protein
MLEKRAASLPAPLPVSARPRRLRGGSVLPGFGLSLGFTLLYLGLMILIPLSTVFLKSATLPWPVFWADVTGPRALAAYRLSLGASFLAGSLNAVFGLLVAWVLERYRFPGRRLVDALVDLPFALPTAVAGIALATLYARNGWIGRWLEPMGIEVAYTRLGVVVALTFIGLPFVVRTVQPVLADLDPEVEEAAASLGAGRWQTFRRVMFIAGNMPMKSEIVPLLIMIKLEQYDEAGATAIALVFLVASFGLLLFINFLAWRRGRRLRTVDGDN